MSKSILVSSVQYLDSKGSYKRRRATLMLVANGRNQAMWPPQVDIEVRAIPGLINSLDAAYTEWINTHQQNREEWPSRSQPQDTVFDRTKGV